MSNPGAGQPLPQGGQMPSQNNSGQVFQNNYLEDFFVYSASLGNLAPAAQANVNLQIQADAIFEWVMATCYGNLHGATPPFTDAALLPVSVQLIDSGSGRQLFSGAIPITSFAGTGKQPFILPVSRFFRARSNIQITATNFDAASTYDNLFLNFIGRKLFRN